MKTVQSEYQRFIRDCRNLQAKPEQVVAGFEKLIRQVSEDAFNQGYDAGVREQEASARAAFMAGVEAGVTKGHLLVK